MKNNKTKVITLSALIIAVIALSIGFAAFSSTLNIQTGASVTPTDTFSVKFASSITGSNGEFTEFQVTPTTPVYKVASGDATPGTPEIDNTDVKNPSIGNLSASFTRPGQSVTYTFYVVNDGNYDAYLTNLVFNNATESNSFKNCVSDSLSSNPATQSLVDNVCSNISFTMSIGNESNIQSSRTLTNHLLTRNHYETVIVTIAYQGEAYADGAFKVNFGDIDLHYSTVDKVEEPQTPAPATSEVAVDALIPTEEQLAWDDSTSDHSFIDTDDIIVKYSDYSGYKYLQINDETTNYEYWWACDNSTASALSSMLNIDMQEMIWYYSTDGETYEEYTGSAPQSLTLFNSENENIQSYLNRVIASFNS